MSSYTKITSRVGCRGAVAQVARRDVRQLVRAALRVVGREEGAAGRRVGEVLEEVVHMQQLARQLLRRPDLPAAHPLPIAARDAPDAHVDPLALVGALALREEDPQ
eukprot:scaffold21080_cov63-Phaeocystis_antarctica.AAC.1